MGRLRPSAARASQETWSRDRLVPALLRSTRGQSPRNSYERATGRRKRQPPLPTQSAQCQLARVEMGLGTRTGGSSGLTAHFCPGPRQQA